MELSKINGNTFYIDNPTNIGVYIFKNKYCLLVDDGINNTVAGKIDELMDKSGLKPKYIVNTHNHEDHAGANSYFREHYPGAVFHASAGEKLFIENGYLFSTYIYGASPIKELRRRSRSTGIDVVLDMGINKIGDEKFEIIPLKGHSIDQIGIGTPDRVCFMGDSLFSESIMEKYTFPFLFDIEEQYRTIEYIKNLDYEYYVLSHGDRIYNSEGIRILAEENRKKIESYLDYFQEILNQPLTREDILEQLCIKYDMKLDFKSYHLCLSSVGAFIAYLYNNDLLDYEVENGKLYYYRNV